MGLLPMVAGSAQGADKVIRMYAGGDDFDYTPSPILVRTESNPYPRNQIRLLANAWEKLNPGYRIEFVNAPPNDLNYRAWCVSNFIGGTVPDIIYQNMGSLRDNDFQKGWVVNMDAYLEQPNPYVPGNTRWKDQFYPIWIDALRSMDGHCYWIAPDTIGVGIICNVDLLRSVGVAQMPQTLGEFLRACAAVRKAGHIAYFPKAEWYVDCVVPSVLWADRIPQMDRDHNGIVSQCELMQAIDSGLLKMDSTEMREYLRLYEALSANYPKGFTTMEPIYVFKQGGVAFLEAQTGQMKRIADDPRRKFEFEIIPFPEITKNDSPLGGTPLAGAGIAGYNTTYQITYKARDHGVLDACVNWMMFLTAPKHCEALVNELGFAIPGVKGAEPIPIFKSLLSKAVDQMQQPHYLDWHAFNPMVSFGNQMWDNWLRIKQSLAMGLIDREEAIKRTDFWLMRSQASLKRRQAASGNP
jgi:ABC-type glycerol-3-phosphate transport system substrate-binding protein